MSNKVASSIDAWDTGQLGRDREFARRLEVTPQQEAEMDESLGLQLISIRLQKGLIEDLKQIAQANGIGYQPLMRQVITRFVDSEKKRIMNEYLADQHKASINKNAAPVPTSSTKGRTKKVA